MKNIMFISNGDKLKRQDANHIKMESFYAPCIKALEKGNYNIYAGINADIEDIKDCDGIHYFNQNVYRSIFAFKDNLKAYRNINTIIKKYNIDVIHCNSPIGGFLGRICGRKNRIKKVIYTAHGFHFYKGNNPIKNFIFKSVEKFLAHYTDTIITMNQEDYQNAQSFNLKNKGKAFLIHGIGIDIKKYQNVRVQKSKKRSELGLKNDDIVLISTGDLVKRKNYSLALNVIANCHNKRIKYIICGNGPELESLKKQAADLRIEKQVLFLGFRKDVKELLKISDIFLFTSLQEGLPRALMEAMASGLPCVVSNIRGNKDLIENSNGGYVCNHLDEYVTAINNLMSNSALYAHLKENNLKKISEYDIKVIAREMSIIYDRIGL